MYKIKYLKFHILLSVLFAFLDQSVFAGIEPYENFINGIKKNDSLIVKDEKFKNNSVNWNDITNRTVKNNISLRINDEALIPANFSCKVTLMVKYFSAPDQVEPLVIDSVKLNVDYSDVAGKPFKIMDNFRFLNGYYVKIYVTDIITTGSGGNSPSLILTSSITIDRKYKFIPDFPINPTIVSDESLNQFKIDWPYVLDAEEYDLEWTTVDSGSISSPLVTSMLTQAHVFNWEIEKIFKNNSTRITTSSNSYNLSALYNSKYLVMRIRHIQYDSTGIRLEGAWTYRQENSVYLVKEIKWNEPNLNWQSSAVYAEEGKKKEVISYFDGSLRGRQTVTVNNSDNVAIVQENVYDKFGRAVASILPAPIYESNNAPYLHYFNKLNLNSANKPYSFKDLSELCEVNPDSLSTSSGAANYYSSQNRFIKDVKYNTKGYNQYIPDAEGYPLSVTQYTPDNTGRIRLQGGVGLTFQPGKSSNSRTTKYYYGKPEQWELDKLFGNDVGYANHYLKNMVVDPNGQISVSYLNASGKTIATALTASAPDSQDALISAGTERTEKISLLSPDRFVFDASDLKLTATTTYLASVKDTASFNFSIEKLVKSYTGDSFQVCSNCFYDLTIKVLDDCNTLVYSTTEPVKIGSDTSDCSNTGLQSGSFNVPFTNIGEYYVTFEFALSRKVLEKFTDNFIEQGELKGFLKSEFDFEFNQLKQTDFTGLFSDCKTCKDLLGTKNGFSEKLTTSLIGMELKSADLNGVAFKAWIDSLYTSLMANCIALRQNCNISPCDQFALLMKDDVSPNGQYALFDEDGVVIEPEINVLSKYWLIEFPVSLPGNSNYDSELITEEDGSVTSPYAEGFFPDKAIKYWKEEWADKFLKYHPEYCKLEFCQTNSSYLVWDDQVKTTINTAADITSIPQSTNLQYLHNEAEWLLNADPFFKPGATGAAYYDFIKDDLQKYSKNVLKSNSGEVKSLTKMVDYLLYCADTTGNLNSGDHSVDSWNNCIPVANCRVPDREWEYYKTAYFEVKDMYFKKVREAACSEVCVVGSPYMLLAPNTYSVKDFSLMGSSIIGSSCGLSLRQVRISYKPGKLKSNVTVQIYYPGQTEPLSVSLTTEEPTKTFCVPRKFPISSLAVSNVIQ